MLRFVGSLQDQLQRLMQLPAQDRSALPVLAEEDAVLSSVVPCERQQAGCEVVYCSAEHRAQDQRQGHALLCTGVAANASAAATTGGKQRGKKQRSEGGGPASVSAATSPSVHPYAAFVAHAEQQHEFFIAAAKIAATIVQQISDGKTEAEAVSVCAASAWAHCCAFFLRSVGSLCCLLLSALHSAPFAAYEQREWWTIVAPEESDEEENGASAAAASSSRKRKQAAVDEADFGSTEGDDSVAGHLRSVVSHSFLLLKSVLFPPHSLLPVPAFFTPRWYARIVGALRLNALAVEHANPLRDYIELVDQTIKRLEQEQAAAEEEEEEAAGKDSDSADGQEEQDSSSSSEEEEDSSDDEENDEEEEEERSPQRKRGGKQGSGASASGASSATAAATASSSSASVGRGAQPSPRSQRLSILLQLRRAPFG